MGNLVNAEAIRVVHGSRLLLDSVSLGVAEGDRTGVVGRNGDGKSTLLRILARRQEPDGGRVTHTGGLRLGMLDQSDASPPGATVRQAVVGDAPDHVWASKAAVRDVLTGLLGGLDAPAVGGLDAPLTTLSGGQRRRVALAGLLAGDDDLVVLDEPTNHLDVEGVAWLAEHVRGRWPAGQGALVVVTHDRWFLDAVCTRVWEVHDGVVDAYDGGYAAYVLTRAERSRVAAFTEERRQNLLRKELAWLRRGAPARTSKPRFRIDAANALIADEPPPRDSVELAKMATTRLGKQVVDLEDVSVAVEVGGAPKVLFDRVTWRLGPGDRTGIVGVNGAGKTTLLGLLTGAVEPDTGVVRRGSTVVVAKLSQEVRELDELADLRALEAVQKVSRHVRMGDRDVPAGQMLERLGFTAQRQWTLVGDLSGGERRRLQLLRLLMTEPNLLLLDEPTNDLDTDTLAAVEDVLDGWPGTLVVVSHDRYLLERVTDRQIALLGDGALRDLPGGVDQYLQLRAETGPAAGPAAAPAAAAASAGGEGASPAQARAARKEMARVERQLQRIAGEEERLHAEMVALATDHAAVTRLDARLRELAGEREELEQAWLEAAEIAE
ncbi:ATPase subunit of ABC transporter with duplicated ATPase domains [Kineococcus xinjiangensis]|uniref:ATPase subunit of ABC transporter with duplicated ATPase domains n=1 Tax=Kineococcus xinjiangensis TaxID=512762 RepID=A0A2S6ISY1_9ACTN|nr:ABC-F family ATP-binding cassette domain-containing protein [Kineococcus xinjiangensis]PPK97255.1 ATPase subunit of ABC transporter with duplicated ATPase domains [Kineococcus xinjiangensis]